MAAEITEKQLRFLNENLDLVAEFLRGYCRDNLIVAVDNFDQIIGVTFTYLGEYVFTNLGEYVDVHRIIGKNLNNHDLWSWQPMLAYVEEHSHRAPILK